MATYSIIHPAQVAMLTLSALFTLLPLLSLTLRLTAHRLAHRPLTASDHCTFLATLIILIFNALAIYSVTSLGVGYAHAAALPPATVETLLKLILAFELMWAVSLSLSKASILLMYCRVFGDGYVKVAARVTLVVVGIWAVEVVLATFLMCRPLRTNWRQVAGAKCEGVIAMYMANGVVNLVTDLVVVLLPLPYLWRLRLPKQTKIGLAIALSLGFLTCIVSILRLAYMHSLDFADVTWTIPLPAIFSGLEPNMAVTLSCVPFLKPVLGLWNGRCRARTERVRVVGATARYDPEHAGQLVLRPDNVAHRAEVYSAGLDGANGVRAGVVGLSDDSDTDLKGSEPVAEITVNRGWKVTREAGDWTQMFGSR